MGFQQQSYNNKPQNYSLIPIFSEFLELYDCDNHSFFQSCEGNFSTTIEANNYHQAGNICGDQYDHDHVIEEIHQQMVDLEKVKQCSSESIDSTSNKAALRRNAKPRMKWTQDLHERFVECVNRLGGAEKARPKAILKLMSSNVLTIFHVKSHLQKYRTSKHIAEYSKEKSENITTLDGTFQLDVNSTGMNIKGALQHVNKRLHEQLEIQHNLQMLIEEQGKQLKMMLEQQEKTNKSLFNKSLVQNSDSPLLTLPKTPCDSFDDDHGSSMEGSRSTRSQSNV